MLHGRSDPVKRDSGFGATEPIETFLRTIVLRTHVERLPVAERDAFVHAVASALPEPVLDNVRLNIVARRGRG